MCNNNNSNKSTTSSDEDEFLIHVYDQMFTTINRIHNNIWDMVIVIVGGMGVWNLYYQCCFWYAFDIIAIGYIIVLSWILTRLVDFNYWCNRNLIIVRNIEDEFLKNSKERIYKNFRAACCNYNRYRTSILIQIFFVGIVLIGTICCYFYFRYFILCKLEHFISPYLFWGCLVIIPFLPALVVHFLRNRDYEEKIL